MIRRQALVVAGAAGPAETAAGVFARFGFADVGQAPSLEQLLDGPEQGRFDLVVVPLQDVTPLQLAALEREVRLGRFGFVIGTAPKPDPELILRAMRAGIHEFVIFPPDPAELAGAVDRLLMRGPAAGAGRQQRGHVIAVHSGKGGVGVTTVALNLAHSFARNDPQTRVALADLVVGGGDVRVMLDLRGGYDMGHLAQKIDRIDAQLLTSLLAPVRGGVWALPSADDPELDDALGGEVTTTAIQHFRAHFAFTVLDCEHHPSERTLAALDAADRIVLVTQPTIPALRSAARTAALCRRLGYADEKLAVVLNRHRPDLDVLTIEDAAKAVGVPITSTLPNDYALCAEALTRGVAVAEVAPHSSLAAAYAELAARLGGAPPPAEATRTNGSGRLGRIMQRIRKAGHG